MDLTAIEMLVSAVQAGSMSGAARKCRVPLPTLSWRIRNLEKALGIQLFVRSARGIPPTEAGTRLYEQAGRGIELLNEALLAVRNNDVHLQGRLRLSVPLAFEPWWPLLGAFQAAYPGISLSLFSTERRVDLIHDGIDVALRVGSVVHESMIARTLYRFRHILVASPHLLAMSGEPSSTEDLSWFPGATWSSDVSRAGIWTLGGNVFSPEPVIVSTDYAYLRHRALAGQVLTELPPFLANSDLASGRLCEVLPSMPMPEQTLSLLYPSYRHQSALVRA